MVWRKKSPAPLHALIPAIPPTDEEHLHSARSYSRRRLQLAEQCKLSVPGHCDSHSLAFLFLFFYGITLRFFCTSLDRIFFRSIHSCFAFFQFGNFHTAESSSASCLRLGSVGGFRSLSMCTNPSALAGPLFFRGDFSLINFPFLLSTN